MPSKLDLDQKLLEEAQRLGDYKYKKDAVNSALREYVGKRKQLKILELFNCVEYLPEYHYKNGRKNR